MAASFRRPSKYLIVRMRPSFSGTCGSMPTHRGLSKYPDDAVVDRLAAAAGAPPSSAIRSVDNQRRQFEHSKLFRISDIDWPGHFVPSIHKPHQAIDQIVDVAE